MTTVRYSDILDDEFLAKIEQLRLVSRKVIVGRIRDWVFGLERAGWIEIIGVDPNHMGQGVGIGGEQAVSTRERLGVGEEHVNTAGTLGSYLTAAEFEAQWQRS